MLRPRIASSEGPPRERPRPRSPHRFLPHHGARRLPPQGDPTPDGAASSRSTAPPDARGWASLFSKTTAYLRIASSVLDFGLFVPAVGLFISLGSVVCLPVFNVLVARRLLQLAGEARLATHLGTSAERPAERAGGTPRTGSGR